MASIAWLDGTIEFQPRGDLCSSDPHVRQTRGVSRTQSVPTSANCRKESMPLVSAPLALVPSPPDIVREYAQLP